MKYSVIRFKDLKICLKELEPFVRDGKHLIDGRPFKKMKLRSREVLGNWLVCVIAQHKNAAGDYTITSDPMEGDGFICNKNSKTGYPTEHLMVYKNEVTKSEMNTEELILQRIEEKKSKGVQYASGKMLVVFLVGLGVWFPDRVAKSLKEPLLFEGIWIFGLDGSQNQYVYDVVELQKDCVQQWKVFISDEFESWEVKED